MGTRRAGHQGGLNANKVATRGTLATSDNANMVASYAEVAVN